MDMKAACLQSFLTHFEGTSKELRNISADFDKLAANLEREAAEKQQGALMLRQYAVEFREAAEGYEQCNEQARLVLAEESTLPHLTSPRAFTL